MRKPTSTNPRSAETSEKIDHCSEGYNSLFKTSLANAGGLVGGLMFVHFLLELLDSRPDSRKSPVYMGRNQIIQNKSTKSNSI